MSDDNTSEISITELCEAIDKDFYDDRYEYVYEFSNGEKKKAATEPPEES